LCSLVGLGEPLTRTACAHGPPGQQGSNENSGKLRVVAGLWHRGRP